MRRTIASAAVLAFSLAALASPSLAAPCKDAKGKFMKCPTPAAKTVTRCKDAKGKFAKCGTPGATPVKA